MISRNKALAMGLAARDRSLEMLNSVDNRVQAAARNAYYEAGDAFDDALGGSVRAGFRTMGDLVHGSRDTFRDGRRGDSEFLATRALQAGGLTVAGQGLANLTQQMSETFGGTGDTRGDNTLYM